MDFMILSDKIVFELTIDVDGLALPHLAEAALAEDVENFESVARKLPAVRLRLLLRHRRLQLLQKPQIREPIQLSVGARQIQNFPSCIRRGRFSKRLSCFRQNLFTSSLTRSKCFEYKQP